MLRRRQRLHPQLKMHQATSMCRQRIQPKPPVKQESATRTMTSAPPTATDDNPYLPNATETSETTSSKREQQEQRSNKTTATTSKGNITAGNKSREPHTRPTREPGLATAAKEPLDSGSNYSGAIWYTAAPGTDHGEPIDLIPYDESDEDDIQHAQTPEQN